MKKILFVLIIVLLAWSTGMAEEVKTFDRSFSGIKAIELKLLSSDCQIKAVGGAAVKVHAEYTYAAELYSPETEAQGDRLLARDRFTDSHSAKGWSKWKIEVPADCRIDFTTASGDLSIEGVNAAVVGRAASGDIRLERIGGGCKLKVASGDVGLTDISGELEVRAASGDIRGKRIKGEKVSLHVASGDIDLDDCRGELSIKAASGDVQAKAVEITKSSVFSSASGDVKVVLAKTPAFDLDLKTFSGDVRLNYNGQPLLGAFELLAHKESGEIVCSLPFDKVEEVVERGQTFVKKSFSRKSAAPRILLQVFSGTVELLEK